MLSILESLNAHARSWALTRDESWFYFSYDSESKWTLARDSSMTKPKALINAPKIMVLVIWGVDGLALIEIITQNLHPSAKYLCEFTILHMEANVKTHCPKQCLKDITFHWDNAPSHTAKMTLDKISELGMNQIPHSPYSSDIAPCDFFLVEDLKHKLQRCFYGSQMNFSLQSGI
jgi:histone-lysine N-methyltransferase SETMAR